MSNKYNRQATGVVTAKAENFEAYKLNREQEKQKQRCGEFMTKIFSELEDVKVILHDIKTQIKENT
jgi:urease accessory protein UreF